MAGDLSSISAVDIDVGRFKYILIKVHKNQGTEEFKYIVRGYKWAGFHGDIYDHVTPAIENKGFDCECVGGGRIVHNADEQTILTFGYSQGFGPADHSITTDLLKKKYPDYKSITWENGGY